MDLGVEKLMNTVNFPKTLRVEISKSDRGKIRECNLIIHCNLWNGMFSENLRRILF